MKNSKGFPTNALYGLVTMINKIILEEKPSYIAVAFDIGKNFRKCKYDFYKEVLRRYRAQTEDLDIMHLQEYLLHFPKAGKIREILEQEVF